MSWQLQEAKNRFSELVECAMKQGPQTVTKHGKPAVVIVSAAEYFRSKDQETLAAILRDCPAKGWGSTRSKDTGRTIRYSPSLNVSNAKRW